MGILKDIWNTVFGKKKQDDKFERGGSIAEPVMKIVHKKSEDKIEAGGSYTENELGEPKPKKQNVRSVIGQKTLLDIKDYLLTYGSIDVITCKAKFDVKSLQNFIWQLRKDGLEIKTEKVGLHNELGQKVEVTNYRLISKK
jgi:hypothetical protein